MGARKMMSRRWKLMSDILDGNGSYYMQISFMGCFLFF